METLKILFPISGVETYFFVPPLLMFVVSFFSSTAGLSGAFLLMPINMSLFGFTAVSVTATNFFYNAVGIPGGVVSYIKEKKMIWPLAIVMISGTLPGVLIGYYLRGKYFLDPKIFKFFVGLVLFFMASRLLLNLITKLEHKAANSTTAANHSQISDLTWNLRQISYTFNEQKVRINVPLILVFAFFVGIVGGIYGIGGGALLVPFCVGFLHIPVHTLPGASLFSTFVTSVAAVIIYTTVPLNQGHTAPPDWQLGLLYGVGGLAGMYLGAKCQRHVPENLIKGLLGILLIFISVRYILQYFS